jgi:hypothetical protein
MIAPSPVACDVWSHFPTGRDFKYVFSLLPDDMSSGQGLCRRRSNATYFVVFVVSEILHKMLFHTIYKPTFINIH